MLTHARRLGFRARTAILSFRRSRTGGVIFFFGSTPRVVRAVPPVDPARGQVEERTRWGAGGQVEGEGIKKKRKQEKQLNTLTNLI